MKTLNALLVVLVLVGSAIAQNSELPQYWLRTKSANNPIARVNSGDANTATEMYQPSAVRLTNGNIVLLVKGTRRIYGFLSTDNGETFAIQNSGAPVFDVAASGQWDDGFVVEPVLVFDSSTSTIHLYYKGGAYTGSGSCPGSCGSADIYGTTGWGHATSAEATPFTFTRDATAGSGVTLGQILHISTAIAALAPGSNPVDLNPVSVIKIGSTWHFYGSLGVGTTPDGANGSVNMFYAAGTTWNNPVTQAYLFDSSDRAVTGFTHYGGAVYKEASSSTYKILYSEGTFTQVGGDSYRQIRVATSTNGTSWTKSDNVFLTSRDTNNTWDSHMVYGPTILRENTAPFVAPITINNAYLVYYSGFGVDNPGLPSKPLSAQTGLLRLRPAFFHDGTQGLYANPSIKLTRNSSQTIPNATTTTIGWDNQVWTDGITHDTVTNNSRMIVTLQGKYRIHVRFTFAANATGHRQVQVYKNGVQVASSYWATMSIGAFQAELTHDDYGQWGDYFEIKAWQSSGGNLAFGGNVLTSVTMSRFAR